MRLILLSSLLLTGNSYAAQSNSTDVRLSLLAPSGSSTLSPTLLSFSYEQDRWPDWAGINSRNQFTYNGLSNYAKNTGQPPKIRVGANSEDRTIFGSTVDIVETVYPANTAITPYPEANNITVGDGFYALSKWMPRGTHMTWGLNLGTDDIQNAVNMATSVMKAFNNGNQVGSTGVYLDLLELGNEADLYKGKRRPSNWTVQQYVTDWISLMTPVIKAIGLTKDSPVAIQGCSFAGQGFTPSQAFADGLLDSEPGKLITTISQHRYSAAFCSGGDFQLTSFMSKAAVRSNITVFSADIVASRAKGFIYILGETNSIACHGAPGVSNTAGASLWTIDYTLQASTRGVSELYFHEGIGFKYNFFQPVTLDRSPVDDSPLSPPLPPHAQPGYYAGIVITEAIGKKAASRQTKIVELDVQEDNISGYAIYEYGVLVRAVFINLDAWLISDEGNRARQTTHVNFQYTLTNGTVSQEGTGQVGVRRLKIAHADDTEHLKWNGQSYETPDLLVSGKAANEQVGWLQGVDISETEAVMLLF